MVGRWECPIETDDNKWKAIFPKLDDYTPPCSPSFMTLYTQMLIN